MESERLERYKDCMCRDEGHPAIIDRNLCEKIRELMNHPMLDEYCMVDAFYYDYSVVPDNCTIENHRDCYLLYGITTQGEMVTKWVDRWDLDE